MAIFEGDDFGAATGATVLDGGRAGLSEKPLLAPIRWRHVGDDCHDHHGFDRCVMDLSPLCFLAVRDSLVEYFV